MRALLLLALLLPFAVPTAQAAEAPVSFRHYRVDIVLEATGQAVQTTMSEVRVNTAAAARQVAQQFIPYINGMEALDLVEGSVRKPDGRVIKLQHEAARPVNDPATNNAPAYDDHRRMALVLPEFGPGDVLFLTMRKRIQQPLFPGQFTFTSVFNRLSEWQDATITLNVPASMAIATDATGLTAETRTEGTRKTLKWHYTVGAEAEDAALVAALDRLPHLIVSTFADWPRFGNAWAEIALPKAKFSDAVRAKAASIVAGISDKRAQAQAIYAWMQKSLRWIPISLGSGSFEPASADTVLSRPYADAKDMAMLMIALLKASNIDAQPVLINNALSYSLAPTPNYASLNHVIVYLPEFGIHADPTAFGAPFGALPFSEYGKTTLRIASGASSLQPIAPLPDRVAGERLRTTMTLDSTGRITGESTNEAIGPFAGDLRRLAATLRAAGAIGASQFLHGLGTDGTGTFAGPEPVDVTPGYGVKSKFELERRAALVDGNPFALPDGMRMLHRPGDILLGALGAIDVPASEPTPCFTGLQEQQIELALPKGTHIARQPKDLRIENDAFTYASTWTVTPGSIKVVRTMQTRFTAPLCTGKTRADAADAIGRIRRDQNVQIWLEAD